MIWLTWRQQRLETHLAAGVMLLIALVLVPTGLHVASVYTDSGVAACLGTHPGSNCAMIVKGFTSQFDGLQTMTGWLNFVPLVFGVLFGAPLVMELENGTYRLAWTQSITREHWITVKLAFVVVAALAVTGIFTALMTWWLIPFDHVKGHMEPNSGFDFEGIVPFAYALFALSLGIAAGTVLRRTIPALVIALVGFLGIRLFIINAVRPHYLSPLRAITPFNGNGPLGMRPGDWVISDGWSDRLGHTISDNVVFQTCDPRGLADKRQLFSCLQHHGFFDAVLYQPASRFWTFQAIEAGIFLVLSAALMGLTVWWIRTRMV